LSGVYGYPVIVDEPSQIVLAPEQELGGGMTGDMHTACEAMSATDAAKVKGKVVVVERGECNFYNKTKVLMDAGATGVVIVNDDDYISRPGVQPKWLGFELFIPYMMVGFGDGQKLMDGIREADGALNVKFEMSASVKQGNWLQLQAFKDKREADDGGWPSKKRERVALYDKIKKEWSEGGASPNAYKKLLEAGREAGLEKGDGEL
jgi:hypothetical protein